MKAVWKYPLQPGQTRLEMPLGAEPLHVGSQGDVLVLWALVDPDAPKVVRLFRILMTGERTSEPLGRYLGTASINAMASFGFMFPNGIVAHVFEEGVRGTGTNARASAAHADEGEAAGAVRAKASGHRVRGMAGRNQSVRDGGPTGRASRGAAST